MSFGDLPGLVEFQVFLRRHVIACFEGGIEGVGVVEACVDGEVDDRDIRGQQGFADAPAAQHVQVLGQAVADGALEQV